MQLTVFYENPFWVGVLERQEDTGFSVCRTVFGAEPRDREVLEFLMTNLRSLRFSDPVPDVPDGNEPSKSPKRVQREAREALQRTPLSTKSQDALRTAMEQKKKVRMQVSKVERDAERERRYALKHGKRKEKKAGH